MMNLNILLYMGLLILDNYGVADGVSINPTGGSAVGDPAPGRSPGPPDFSQQKNELGEIPAEVVTNCELEGSGNNTENELSFNFTIYHKLFSTEHLVPGLIYEGMLKKLFVGSL